jgi:hypothetical protein
VEHHRGSFSRPASLDGNAWDPGGQLVLNLVFSQPPKILNSPRAWLPGRPFGFQVSGLPGVPYRVQASTNLLDWTDVSGTLTGPAFNFSDANTTGFRQRYYRVIQSH